jgi:tetratricopeptide (TPR) repeat protein
VAGVVLFWRRGFRQDPASEKTGPDWRYWNEEGTRAFHENRLEEARKLFLQALVSTDHFGLQDRRRAICLNNIGAVARALGELEAAEAAFVEALEIRQESLGSTHPMVAQSLRNLAELLHLQGRLSEAEELYRACLEIRCGALEAARRDLLLAHTDLGRLLLEREAYAESVPLLRRALELHRDLSEGTPLDLVPHLDRLALALRKSGDLSGAVEVARDALKGRQGLPPQHTERVTGLVHLALCLEAAGEPESAQELLLAAASLLEAQLALLEREGEHEAASRVRQRLEGLRRRL